MPSFAHTNAQANVEFTSPTTSTQSGSSFITTGSNACMIAAVCIREGVPLLHDDADFDRIADVSDLKVA